MINVVFTDLDGTLLDRDTYSWEAAKPALEHLKHLDDPWILVTSKTRAEVQRWRSVLGNQHPFVVENGAAAFIPSDYFHAAISGATLRGGYEVVQWGKPYEEVVAGLQAASRFARCRVVGFHEMSAEELATACRLSVEDARLAKQREYDEPFRIMDTGRTAELKAAILAQGLRWTQGGHFYHVCKDHDKGSAIRMLADFYRRVHGQVITMGLGDSLNDAPLLEAVDLPVIVRSSTTNALRSQIPYAHVTAKEGPEGWNEAVLRISKATGRRPPRGRAAKMNVGETATAAHR